jgi:TusA-related sulfurtransferase
MSGENFVDARGMSCPEPVLMAEEAVKKYDSHSFTIAVSSLVARDNVLRFLEKKGLSPSARQEGRDWLIKVPE